MTNYDQALSDEYRSSDVHKREKPKDIYRLLDLFKELYDEARDNKYDDRS